MSFKKNLVANSRSSYHVKWTLSHVSVLAPVYLYFILHEKTGRKKVVKHHGDVVGCGQGNVFS